MSLTSDPQCGTYQVVGDYIAVQGWFTSRATISRITEQHPSGALTLTPITNVWAGEVDDTIRALAEAARQDDKEQEE